LESDRPMAYKNSVAHLSRSVHEVRRQAMADGAAPTSVTPTVAHSVYRACPWVVEELEPPSWLAGSYMWAAVLADLHRRGGHDEIAQRYRDAAVKSAPSLAVRDLLKRRLWTSRVTALYFALYWFALGIPRGKKQVRFRNRPRAAKKAAAQPT